jgi:hypothetical protein
LGHKILCTGIEWKINFYPSFRLFFPVNILLSCPGEGKEGEGRKGRGSEEGGDCSATH